MGPAPRLTKVCKLPLRHQGRLSAPRPLSPSRDLTCRRKDGFTSESRITPPSLRHLVRSGFGTSKGLSPDPLPPRGSSCTHASTTTSLSIRYAFCGLAERSGLRSTPGIFRPFQSPLAAVVLRQAPTDDVTFSQINLLVGALERVSSASPRRLWGVSPTGVSAPFGESPPARLSLAT